MSADHDHARGGGGQAGDPRPEFISPPDTLRDKAPMTADGVNPQTLAEAEKIIAGMQSNYLEWVEDDLARLQALVAEMDAAAPEGRKAVLDRIFEVAHDVKGQGGSFDYPLMTAIGNQLCRFIERLEGTPTDVQLQVVRLHVDALRLVIAERMSGDGGPAGERLVGALKAAVDKATAG